MSNKVPVFRSVGSAYGFLFNNFFAIIRMIWLPSAIVWIGTGVLFYLVFTGFLSSGSAQSSLDQAIERFDQYTNIIALLGVGSFLMIFVISMAPYRIYFDLPRGESILYLRFGLPEFRYLIFLIVLQILLGLVVVPFGLVTDFLAALLENSTPIIDESSAYFPILPVQNGVEQPSPAAIAFLLVLILQIATVIFISIRFSIGPAVIAAEGKVGLIQSWRLTRGNFWRLFLGTIMLIISILIVLVVVFFLAFLIIFLPLSLLGAISTEMLYGIETREIPIGIGSATSFVFLFVLQLCFFAVALGMPAGFLGRAYEGIIEGD